MTALPIKNASISTAVSEFTETYKFNTKKVNTEGLFKILPPPQRKTYKVSVLDEEYDVCQFLKKFTDWVCEEKQRESEDDDVGAKTSIALQFLSLLSGWKEEYLLEQTGSFLCSILQKQLQHNEYLAYLCSWQKEQRWTNREVLTWMANLVNPNNKNFPKNLLSELEKKELSRYLRLYWKEEQQRQQLLSGKALLPKKQPELVVVELKKRVQTQPRLFIWLLWLLVILQPLIVAAQETQHQKFNKLVTEECKLSWELDDNSYIPTYNYRCKTDFYKRASEIIVDNYNLDLLRYKPENISGQVIIDTFFNQAVEEVQMQMYHYFMQPENVKMVQETAQQKIQKEAEKQQDLLKLETEKNTGDENVGHFKILVENAAGSIIQTLIGNISNVTQSILDKTGGLLNRVDRDSVLIGAGILGIGGVGGLAVAKKEVRAPILNLNYLINRKMRFDSKSK